MMQPRRADVGAAMIAYGAKHSRLQIPKGHVVGEPADVQFGVMMTVRIAAVDDHMSSSEASHVGQRHWLIVKQQVRDRPGHAPSKRGLCR
jgi:hypothetical protein